MEKWKVNHFYLSTKLIIHELFGSFSVKLALSVWKRAKHRDRERERGGGIGLKNKQGEVPHKFLTFPFEMGEKENKLFIDIEGSTFIMLSSSLVDIDVFFSLFFFAERIEIFKSSLDKQNQITRPSTPHHIHSLHVETDSLTQFSFSSIFPFSWIKWFPITQLPYAEGNVWRPSRILNQFYFELSYLIAHKHIWFDLVSNTTLIPFEMNRQAGLIGDVISSCSRLSTRILSSSVYRVSPFTSQSLCNHR